MAAEAPNEAQLEPLDTTANDHVIRRLYDITSKHDDGFAKQMRALLHLGCERFGLEIGILSQIDGNRYRVVHQVCPEDVPLEDDVEFDLPKTYCSVTVRSKKPTGYEHVAESELAAHPAYAEFKLESYIGIPIIIGGDVYGTLNFSSPVPRARKFHEIDIDALKLMAIWIEGELCRQLFEEKILHQSRLLTERNEQLRLMAQTDQLTRVGNRNCFFQKLEHNLKFSQRLRVPLSLVMFDIDHFKRYNDTYGHVAGDHALATIAQTVDELARDTDYVARYGGEEFAVLLTDTNYKNALVTAERFRAAIEAIDDLDCSVSSSFGVSTCMPESGDKTDFEALGKQLIDEADQALYHSKHLGRNRVSHYNALDVSDRSA